jgi:hypothetical protein
MAMDPED